MKMNMVLGLSLGVLFATKAFETRAAERAVDGKMQEETVNAIARVLVDRYTFPEIGQQMADRLRANLAQGDYNTLTNGGRLAARLTEDVRAISHDKHLRVQYSPEPLKAGSRPEKPSLEEEAAFRENQRRENGGLTKAEILPGNIGYLHLRYFGIAAAAGPRMAGAMAFLAGTDALVIDLRNNGGAIDPGTIAILCSYFFPEERVHLNSLHWREGNRVEQSWTLPLLPGPRYLDKPVYVLTSRRTFSGAEEFAYNLQTRKRATIVGAVTGGGANPGGDEILTDHFTMFVPTGRAVNPVTGTNWEGTGVKPDVETKPEKSLVTAQKLAIETILKRQDMDANWTRELTRRLAKLEEELRRSNVKANFQLNGFPLAKRVSVVGSFNDWNPDANAMGRNGDGWTASLEVEPGRHTYKFWVDGEWLIDPRNALTEVTDEGHTNSVIQVSAPAN